MRFETQRKKLRELDTFAQTSNLNDFPKAANEWGSAGVIITSDPNRHPWEGNILIVAEYALELSWLFEQLRDIFGGLMDGSNQTEFYRRIVEASIPYIAGAQHRTRYLYSVVVLEAFTILNEMESGKFSIALPVSPFSRLSNNTINDTQISSLEIKNFRCFGTTKARGFVRINLFGGRNNAGKTSLLEALLLMAEPSKQSILKLLDLRRADEGFIKLMPSRAWENFFLQQRMSAEISLAYSTGQGNNNSITITNEEVTDGLIKMSQKDSDSVKSTLHTTVYKNDKKVHSNTVTATSKGIDGRGGAAYVFMEAYLVPANSKLSDAELAMEFDKTKFETDAESDALLKAFQLIDPTIEKVDSLKIGAAALYLKRKGEKYMPLPLFGDAMNKIANYVLRIVNNPNSILLVDEIENGIHYENQENIWAMLFDLCKAFNVQLFATTHSAEMIEAFKNTIQLKGFEEEAGYFEMYKSPKSNEIAIQKIPVYSLEDKLNRKSPIRGEHIDNKRRPS